MKKIIHKLNDYIAENRIDRSGLLLESGVREKDFNDCLAGRRELMADELLKICAVLKLDPLTLLDQKEK